MFCFSLATFIWIDYYTRFIQYFNGSYIGLLHFLLIIYMVVFGQHQHTYAGNLRSRDKGSNGFGKSDTWSIEEYRSPGSKCGD